MSQYKYYCKAEPVVGGFTVDPETQTISVHDKGKLPFTYEDLISKGMKAYSISGHTFVWYFPGSTGVEWVLETSVDIFSYPGSYIKFRGPVYVTGSMSFSPRDENTASFLGCGISESSFRERVIFDNFRKIPYKEIETECGK